MCACNHNFMCVFELPVSDDAWTISGSTIDRALREPVCSHFLLYTNRCEQWENILSTPEDFKRAKSQRLYYFYCQFAVSAPNFRCVDSFSPFTMHNAYWYQFLPVPTPTFYEAHVFLCSGHIFFPLVTIWYPK